MFRIHKTTSNVIHPTIAVIIVKTRQFQLLAKFFSLIFAKGNRNELRMKQNKTNLNEKQRHTTAMHTVRTAARILHD